MKTIIFLELKKVLRSRLWQMSLLLCLILSAFCLYLEKENSTLPPLQYPEEAALVEAPVSQGGLMEKQKYYAGQQIHFTQAAELFSQMTMAGFMLPEGASPEGALVLDPEALHECQILLGEGQDTFQRKKEITDWYARYYTSLSQYGENTQAVLDSLDRHTPFLADQPENQKEQIRTLYTDLLSQEMSDSNFLFWEMFSQSLNFLFWMAALIVTAILFLESDEKARMQEQIRVSTVSMPRLRLCRLLALSALLAGVTIAFLAVSLGTCALLYGLPDWNCAVQTVPALQTCPYPWTVGGWFLRICLLQLVQADVLGAFLMLLHICLGRRGYIVFFSGLAVSVLLTLFIGDYTILEWLKYLNLYALLHPAGWFTGLHFFGSFTSDVWSLLLLGLLLPGCAACLILVPGSTRVRKNRQARRRLPAGSGRIPAHQLHCMTIHNPCLVLFICTLLFAVYGCASAVWNQGHSENAQQLVSLYQTYGGPLNADKLKGLQQKKVSYEKLDASLQEAAKRYSAGEMSEEDYFCEMNAWNQENRERSLWNVLFQDVEQGKRYLGYARGFQMLLGLNTSVRDENSALLTALMILFLCSSLFSSEHRVRADDLFRTTPGNDRRLKWKLILAFGAALCICLLVSGLDFLRTSILYPMEDWNMPMLSVLPAQQNTVFMDFSLAQIPVGQIYARVCTARLLGAAACLFLVLICSMYSDSPAESVLLGISVLATGWLLIQAGLESVALVFPRKLLEGSRLVLANRMDWSFVITGLLFLFAWKQYRKKQRLFAGRETD